MDKRCRPYRRRAPKWPGRHKPILTVQQTADAVNFPCLNRFVQRERRKNRWDIFVLKGPAGMARIIRKPKITTSNSKVMSKAIRHELESAQAWGREFSAARVIRLFRLSTGKLRMAGAEAAQLFAVVNKAMKEEIL